MGTTWSRARRDKDAPYYASLVSVSLNYTRLWRGGGICCRVQSFRGRVPLRGWRRCGGLMPSRIGMTFRKSRIYLNGLPCGLLELLRCERIDYIKGMSIWRGLNGYCNGSFFDLSVGMRRGRPGNCTCRILGLNPGMAFVHFSAYSFVSLAYYWDILVSIAVHGHFDEFDQSGSDWA